MFRKFTTLIGVMAAVILTASPVVALDAATWQRDAELVENGLIRTLDESFQRTRDREGWRDYYDQYVAGLDRFNGLVDPQSLALLREIGEELRLNFDVFSREERWQDASYFVRSRVVFASFVLGTHAASLDHATWERDSLLVDRALIAVLDAAFANTRREEDWREYQGQFAEKLTRFDGVMNQSSLSMMREIADQLQQNFNTIERIDEWGSASYFLRSSIIYTSFVLRASER